MTEMTQRPARCPACDLDWTSAAAVMQSWQPCGCATVRGGHRVYVCMACRSKLYDSAHLAPVLQLVPGTLNRGRETKRSPSRRGFG